MHSPEEGLRHPQLEEMCSTTSTPGLCSGRRMCYLKLLRVYIFLLHIGSIFFDFLFQCFFVCWRSFEPSHAYQKEIIHVLPLPGLDQLKKKPLKHSFHTVGFFWNKPTCDFSFLLLKALNKYLNDILQSCPVPHLADGVEKVLLGIKYTTIFPEQAYTLPNNLTIYREAFYSSANSL